MSQRQKQELVNWARVEMTGNGQIVATNQWDSDDGLWEIQCRMRFAHGALTIELRRKADGKNWTQAEFDEIDLCEIANTMTQAYHEAEGEGSFSMTIGGDDE